MDFPGVLVDQAGVISRRQAKDAGLSENDLRRMIRRRELVMVHPGVYVNHTGELTWMQRAWAAVLFADPAALSHDSALRVADGPGKHDDEIVHVAVARHRRITAPDGVVINRISHLDDRTMWNRSPPRVRYEAAGLDVAIASRSEMAALDVLASAVQSRRTTARRMLTHMEGRARSPRRAWLVGVLHDVSDGACSVLEHGYLQLVERAHGLPRAERQRRATATLGVVYRDASYGVFLLELDGRLVHDTAGQRDRWDLDAAVDGQATIRLGYGQVFARPRLTAKRLALLLQKLGWTGEPHPCGPGCPMGGA
jgi:hypothetical protein